MALTTAGRDLIASLIIGGAGTPFDAGNTYIGVGDSADAFDVAQTDLQASTNVYRQAMEASYPSALVNVISFQALFATSVANFAWEEWGVFNAATVGTMLSRKVESLGTKTSAQSWLLTVQLTLTVA